LEIIKTQGQIKCLISFFQFAGFDLGLVETRGGHQQAATGIPRHVSPTGVRNLQAMFREVAVCSA